MGFHDIDHSATPPEPELQRFEHISHYARSERLPWRRRRCTPNEELRSLEAMTDPARERAFPLRVSSYVPRRIFREILKQRFEAALSEASVHSLRRAAPEASAHRLMTGGQKFVFASWLLAVAALFAAAPLSTLIAFNYFLTVYFLTAIFFRLYLTIASLADRGDAKRRYRALDDGALPVVTVLLPVYDEAEGLAALRAAIDAIDYPADRLDVKLIMEADDAATVAEARRLGLDRAWDCVIVPISEPRTKPKACNHALYLARGDIIVIYDAEDAPEPDQVRKAAAAFAAGDETLACVQARLNYYNADENWLTRLFALEYALWFDYLLPALERLHMPIPLGGTSNFFRTQTLIEIGGWDPFNVTEDADLGLRLARRGYRTEILDSTTFEEANCRTDNWIRQRSRWMKGYMQTWLVHMRDPRAFFRVVGWRGVLAAQLFIAGNFFSALINPLLWAVFTLWLATRAEIVSSAFPGPLLVLNMFALLVGNCFFIYLAVIAPLKRGWAELSPSALLAPAYWLLSSLAAYKALWQLATRPSFWEKTQHGLSAAAKERRAVAASEGETWV